MDAQNMHLSFSDGDDQKNANNHKVHFNSPKQPKIDCASGEAEMSSQKTIERSDYANIRNSGSMVDPNYRQIRNMYPQTLDVYLRDQKEEEFERDPVSQYSKHLSDYRKELINSTSNSIGRKYGSHSSTRRPSITELNRTQIVGDQRNLNSKTSSLEIITHSAFDSMLQRLAVLEEKSQSLEKTLRYNNNIASLNKDEKSIQENLLQSQIDELHRKINSQFEINARLTERIGELEESVNFRLSDLDKSLSKVMTTISQNQQEICKKSNKEMQAKIGK